MRTDGAGGETAGAPRLMAAVAHLAAQRLARHWRALVAIGVLLGLAFGLCLACVAAARRTASAYGRIQEAAGTEGASIFHFLPPDEAEGTFAGLEGLEAQHHRVGFGGVVDGIDPALTRGMIAPVGRAFIVEEPRLRAGRLPDPAAPEEVFVNSYLADRAGLRIGQHLDLSLLSPDGSGPPVTEQLTIVGIGTMPSEVVVDETAAFGFMLLTSAFYDAHQDLVIYAATGVDLAPGLDARRDLGPAVGALGFELQQAREQGRQSVNDALRPLVTILGALALLALGAATIAAVQAVQREQERWRADDDNLRVLGMVRAQTLLVGLASTTVVAITATAVAMAVVLVASPLAPVGPLRPFDPERGYSIDLTVAAAGLMTIWVILTAVTVAVMRRPASARAGTLTKASGLSAVARGPATVAGLALALRAGGGRRDVWRSVGATTAAVALTATIATVVVAIASLSATPDRYGLDWDLIAVTQFGDQTPEALRTAFGDDGDIVGVTGFTTAGFVINGLAVPGVATTPIKGEVGPTLLRGVPVRNADEIALGQDVLDGLEAKLDDIVQVQLFGDQGEPLADPIDLRVVGVVTFPPVGEPGADHARLGTGALVTREAYEAMGAPPSDQPEWTALRLADGVRPATVVERNPDGVPDAFQTPTEWFTDAKPAELRQLDSVQPLLVGAIAVTLLIAVAVITHAAWSGTRSHRRQLAALRTIGFTRRQLVAVAAWQTATLAVAGVLIGIPVGIALGRWAFSLFARSLAVVDTATTPSATVAALVLATLAAAGLGSLSAMSVACRLRTATVLRAG